MSRVYKNILKLRNKIHGRERQRSLIKEVVKDSTPLPKPLEYEDIDEEFNRWVKEELYVTFEGEELPTFALFSNQRFSEFIQSWNEVDDKKNLIMNFKTISRENNPKTGSILGNTKNIPGDHYILMKRVKTYDKANRPYYIDYKIRQPFSIDFIYTVGIVTNKYELLNKFNQLINDKFKAINCYIRPNGYFVPMKLNDISDESEYNIDNRVYYSQNYSITVMAYIIPRDSFKIEERPSLRFIGFDGDINRRSYAEIEEIENPCQDEDITELAFQPVNIKIHFSKCDLTYKFNIDIPFKLEKITLKNIRNYKVFINDNETTLENGTRIESGDEIRIRIITKFKTFEDSDIYLEGYNFKQLLKKEDIVNVEEIIVN